MEHTLISTIIGGIVTAFVFGVIARQLKLPAILGYLVAGVVIGPHTPGFVADVALARQLAEIGIILLMFGVGLHFSPTDLMQSRRIAIPGALAQMISATAIGAMLGLMLGHDFTASMIFGFSLSVASTIVLIRSLEQRNLLASSSGKLAVSWLIVEDIFMVVALVMIPVFADLLAQNAAPAPGQVISKVLEVLFKIAGFFLFMLVAGRRFLPWLLVKTAKMRSAELNTIGTLAIALGFASIAYVVFNASLALGAFLAGVMLNESEIGRKSAEHSVQMRDAFSVLFFVSVGMLFDPRTLILYPIAVLSTFMVIVFAKGIAAYAITHWFGQPVAVKAYVSAGLAQIGEFSFILGGLALTKGLINQDLYNLILAGAILTIIANPWLFRFVDTRLGR